MKFVFASVIVQRSKQIICYADHQPLLPWKSFCEHLPLIAIVEFQATRLSTWHINTTVFEGVITYRATPANRRGSLYCLCPLVDETRFVNHLWYFALFSDWQQWCRRRVQAHPQKFWFVENLGKIHENLGKNCWNLGKIPENLPKFQENLGNRPENPGKMAPNVVWFPNTALTWCKTFFQINLKKCFVGRKL